MKRLLLLAALVAGALAPAAEAGGWATVQLSAVPTDGMSAGTTLPIDITVLQHGQTPPEGVVPGQVGEQLDEAAEDLEGDEQAEEDQAGAQPVARRLTGAASAWTEPARRGRLLTVVIGNLLFRRSDRTPWPRPSLAGGILLELAPLHLLEQLVEPGGHGPRILRRIGHSHSIVAGGFELMS